MADESFKVVKDAGSFGDGKWQKHLALVSWFGREPNWEIRSWNPDMTRAGKGVVFADKSELFDLMSILEDVFDGDGGDDA